MSFMTHMHKIIQLKITCTTANSKINGTEKIGLKVLDTPLLQMQLMLKNH